MRQACGQAVQELLDAGVQTFAVAFLWSFRNPEHERIAAPHSSAKWRRTPM